MKNKIAMTAVPRLVMTAVWLGLVGLAGCTSLSPSSADIPGTTTADREGQKIILDHIRWLEAESDRRDGDLQVVWTKVVGTEMRTIIEHWTVENCGIRTVYKVRIAPLGDGRWKYTVTYPLPADL